MQGRVLLGLLERISSIGIHRKRNCSGNWHGLSNGHHSCEAVDVMHVSVGERFPFIRSVEVCKEVEKIF